MSKRATFAGWKMTKLQHDLLLFQLWPAACDYQGWASSVREAKRREVTAEVFNGPKSWKEINRTNEFDAIKTRLEELAGKVVIGGDDAGDRNRLLHRVGELTAEFDGEREAYMMTILRERFRVVPGVRNVTDLSVKELRELSITLTDRLKRFQQKETKGTKDEPF